MSRLLPCLGKWGAASLTVEDIHGQNFLLSHPSTLWWILLHLQRHPEHPALTVLCDKILFVFLGLHQEGTKSPDAKWCMKLQKSWTSFFSKAALPLAEITPYIFEFVSKVWCHVLALDQRWVFLKWPANVQGQAAPTGGGSIIGVGTVSSLYNWQRLFRFQRHEEMRSNELGLFLSQRFSTCGSNNLGGEMSLSHEDGNKP